jgi:hypothetical protein
MVKKDPKPARKSPTDGPASFTSQPTTTHLRERVKT